MCVPHTGFLGYTDSLHTDDDAHEDEYRVYVYAHLSESEVPSYCLDCGGESFSDLK